MADAIASIQQAVRSAGESRTALAICGNGSKGFAGRTVTAEPLDVSANAGVVAYEPTELVITVRGGTTIADIETALFEHGQCLAAEPPRFDGNATIAGTLACNLSGPGRPWCGSIRDHVLGLRIVNGRGEHLRFGGKVMKNVAGYDVSRLQAGALGTLGIITEVTLRVQPMAQHTLTLRQQHSATDAVHIMNAWSGRNVPVSAASWYDGELTVRLSGEGSAIEAIAAKLGGDAVVDARAYWGSVRELAHPFFDGDKPLWRFSVRSNAAPNADDPGFINWGGAERWLRGDYDKAGLEAAAEAAHGEVCRFRGGERGDDVFHSRSPAQQRIHQRIKAAFDPYGVLNPGRLYSWM